MHKPTIGSIRRVLAACAAAALALTTPSAQASFLEGEALDTMANVVSWFAITIVPIGVIWLFWMVHVLPEKIAEKKGHPNAPAIKVLCLLSLVFGGLLWPLAWLWAYTKPSMYKLAYGTDRVDYHTEEATPEPAAEDEDAGRTA
jgi:CBS domain containing-hemolysin-like protein